MNPSQMTEQQFVETFGSVYEHAPWIAQRAHANGLTRDQDSANALATAMAAVVAGASHEDKIKLLRGHPDLAGRLALAGDMTDASIQEQSSAGLSQCTPEELAKFQELNEAYTQKFGFPFILAVRGHQKEEILRIFSDRVNNDPDVELHEELAQVNKIARLRIEELFRA